MASSCSVEKVALSRGSSPLVISAAFCPILPLPSLARFMFISCTRQRAALSKRRKNKHHARLVEESIFDTWAQIYQERVYERRLACVWVHAMVYKRTLELLVLTLEISKKWQQQRRDEWNFISTTHSTLRSSNAIFLVQMEMNNGCRNVDYSECVA